MDWDRAIERNREALLRIVGALFALLSGARIGAGPGLMLPRRVWLALLQGLRPAEACLRRLVLIAARNLVPELAPASRRNAPFPAIAASAVSREPAFRLIEPLKRFSQDGFSDDDDAFVAQALASETAGAVDGAACMRGCGPCVWPCRTLAVRPAVSPAGRRGAMRFWRSLSSAPSACHRCAPACRPAGATGAATKSTRSCANAMDWLWIMPIHPDR